MAAPSESLSVGIAGAGGIAYGAAALLESTGHRAMLWSPSGQRTRRLAAGEPLLASGLVEGRFHPRIAADAAELVRENQIILVAVPGFGHKTVYDAIAPHLTADKAVLISSHASLGALYLSQLLAARGVVVPITAWGTTVTTGPAPSAVEARVNTIRSKVDICTVPQTMSAQGLARCQALFGDRFVERDGLLAITLSNVNPQNHLAIALCNMTRMERGEAWEQCLNITPHVGRLIEALDLERLAICQALGLSVRTVREHFHLSYQLPMASVSHMNQEMNRQGRDGNGPATADSRYVTEDAPYGLLVTVKLGLMAGRPAVLHQAGLDLLSVLYGRDFAADNNLLAALTMDELALDDLQALARQGYAAQTPSARNPGPV